MYLFFYEAMGHRGLSLRNSLWYAAYAVVSVCIWNWTEVLDHLAR